MPVRPVSLNQLTYRTVSPLPLAYRIIELQLRLYGVPDIQKDAILSDRLYTHAK